LHEAEFMLSWMPRQFSQRSTNTLQEALTSLQTRHAATLETLSTQLTTASSQLESSERRAERLRFALDELGGDILKETYGRRREVALRIRMINREEKIREELERWVRRADEAFSRNTEDSRKVHDRMLQDARTLLSSTLDGPPVTPPPSSGSLARIIAAQSAVEFLSNELQRETARRFELERFVARSAVHDGPIESLLLPAYSPPSAESLVQMSQMAEPPRNTLGGIAADKPSLRANGTILPIVQPSSTSTSDDLCREPILNVLHARNVDQDRTQSSSNSSTTTPLVMRKDDRVAQIPMIVVVSDDTSQSSAASYVNGDSFIPDPPPSEAASLSKVNKAFEVSVAGPAPDITPPPFDIENVAEPHGSSELGPSGVANDDFCGQSPITESTSTLSEIAEGPSPPASPSALSISSESAAELPPALVSSSPLAAEVASLVVPRIPPSEPDTYTAPDTLPLVYSDVSQQVSQHPLLANLRQVQHRYDDLQHAFRDCHLALEALKSNLSSSPDTSSVPPGIVSPGVLRTALDRLNDYTEDARVELEIRIADEALMAHGFEALLSVPGALSSASISSISSLSQYSLAHDDHEASLNQSEVESQIEAFISGTDLSVQKSQRSLSRKLDDIQHDIASIKLAVHDMPPTPLSAPTSNEGGGGWTSWIRSSPSAPLAPGSAPELELGTGPAPTFGNVMTSPRLRHSPSLNFQVQSKKGDPFASLGLRVPMPSHVPQGVTQVPQRPRTVSAMYMLGLGARRPNPDGPLVSAAHQNGTRRVMDTGRIESESAGTTGDDGDVE
jgi:hypothetical protein